MQHVKRGEYILSFPCCYSATAAAAIEVHVQGLQLSHDTSILMSGVLLPPLPLTPTFIHTQSKRGMSIKFF
jgi:hypothetical protein